MKDKRLLMLGAGGAVRGVIAALQQQGVNSITLANRTHARAVELAALYSSNGDIQACEYCNLTPGGFDVIINGTSAGLQGELPPLADSLAANTCCYDMVYADTETVFVKWARENGANRAVDGLGMLVRQAAESFYIWRQVKPDADPVIKLLRKKT